MKARIWKLQTHTNERISSGRIHGLFLVPSHTSQGNQIIKQLRNGKHRRQLYKKSLMNEQCWMCLTLNTWIPIVSHFPRLTGEKKGNVLANPTPLQVQHLLLLYISEIQTNYRNLTSLFQTKRNPRKKSVLPVKTLLHIRTWCFYALFVPNC